MTTHLIATIIDHSISILGGIVGLLVGFRLIGPKPNIDPKYDIFYKKFAKHLKWLAPLYILFTLIQIGVSVYGSV
jgi:hypothetical protein